ncbi:MAG: hypothetical protein K2P93_05225 [Alphaproteobacteria bacterium]|nr:hypothetical protein [Alphaproteobacteria bacterium]
MKNYLFFLLLTTTTFVHAGQNFELSNDWNNEDKLQAKRLKLEEKISSNLTSSTLIKNESSYRIKLLIINELLEDKPSQLNIRDENSWKIANISILEKKQQIKNAAEQFVKKNGNISLLSQKALEEAISLGEHFYLLHKISSYMRFFDHSSDERKTLKSALNTISEIRYFIEQGNEQHLAKLFLAYQERENELKKALKEGEKRQQQAFSLIDAMIRGRYADLQKNILVTLENQEVKSRETESKLHILLNTMDNFNVYISNFTKEYLEKEQEVVKVLPSDKELGDTASLEYVPTTFTEDRFSSFSFMLISPPYRKHPFPFTSRGMTHEEYWAQKNYVGIFKEDERKPRQARSLAKAMLNGSYAELEYLIRNALKNQKLKDQKTKSKLGDLLKIMEDFFESIANFTNAYLMQEPEAIKSLPLDETHGNILPFRFIPTTFTHKWNLNKCCVSITPAHKSLIPFPQEHNANYLFFEKAKQLDSAFQFGEFDPRKDENGALPTKHEKAEVLHKEDNFIKNQIHLLPAFNSSFNATSIKAIPRGYQLVLDPAQKRGTNVPLGVTSLGKGHLAIEGDGYVFYQQLSRPDMAALNEKTISFEVDVKSDTPGAYIQYWGYPLHQKAKSMPHSGDGQWQTLTLEFTVDKNDQAFYIYPAIMPGIAPGSKTPEVEIRGVKIREIEQTLSLTFNSSFHAASEKAIPQGYKLVLDPAQKRGTNVPLGVTSLGKGHLAIEGDGYVFYQQLSRPDMAALNEKTISFEVDVKSDTPGAYIQYWGYPLHQKAKSMPHSGDGQWQTLTLEFTVDKNDQAFYIYPAIMPGVAPGSKTPVVEIKDAILRPV